MLNVLMVETLCFHFDSTKAILFQLDLGPMTDGSMVITKGQRLGVMENIVLFVNQVFLLNGAVQELFIKLV